MRRELSIFRRFFIALRRRIGGRVGFVGAFASAVSSLTPARRSRPVFSPRPWVPPLPAKLSRVNRLQRALLDVSSSLRQKPEPEPIRLGLFILGSRSAQRGPFTFISRQKIDTRPLRPVASKKLRKSARRRLRTASNGAAALGWRATQARETLPRLRAMPDGRRGPLTGCMHTKTAGRSFGRTALRVGPPAPGQRWLHTRREDFETRPDLPE